MVREVANQAKLMRNRTPELLRGGAASRRNAQHLETTKAMTK